MKRRVRKWYQIRARRKRAILGDAADQIGLVPTHKQLKQAKKGGWDVDRDDRGAA